MGGAKRTPTIFSPATSTNVRINPQNFMTFSLNPFATPVQNFKAIPSVSFKLWTKILPWTKTMIS